VKNSIGKKTRPTKSLTKLLLPSAATGLVIATVISTLSTSVVAYEARSKLVTPAQVEKVLSALLETRETNIQLAAYSPNQASNSAKQSVRYTPQPRKVDHSNKSVAELIMAGLAITEEAKSELSSSANDQTSEPEPSAEQPEFLEEAVIAAAPVVVEGSVILEAVIEEAAIAAVPIVVEEPDIIEAVIEEAAIAAAPIVVKEPLIVEAVIEEAAIAAAPIVVKEPLIVEAVIEEAFIAAAPIVVEEPDIIEAVIEEAAFAAAPVVVEGSVILEAVIEEAAIAAVPIVVEEPDIIEAVIEEAAIAAAPIVVKEPLIVEAVIEEAVIEEAVIEEAVIEKAVIAAAPIVVEEPLIVEAVIEEAAFAAAPVVVVEAVTEEAAIAAAPVVVEEPVLAQLKTMSTSSLEAQDNDDLPALPVPMQKKTAETAATANIEVPNNTVFDAKPELASQLDSAEAKTNELKTEEPETLLASVSATTLPTEIDSGVNTSMNSNLVDNVGANVDVAIHSEGCPENFNKISIPVNGKLCQIFAADFPASMILFVPETPEDVIKYYLASSDSFVEPKTIKKRTMLKSADNNTTLIISKDGGGTQVDILVKAPVS
jgi:hypothetical protein